MAQLADSVSDRRTSQSETLHVGEKDHGRTAHNFRGEQSGVKVFFTEHIRNDRLDDLRRETEKEKSAP
ncbi:hypothetical protein Y032_0790g2366 [Ancylostoma ceylanicum]|uniref:Uncharacterized protein n=1 Tax=Ancylostoma ceylanicum TaxID=53326 RepID=A0A016WEK7_9BILA|nr:hypothetical protein Y032_0790g2366 [Ancylostoma ceylanicum]